MAYEFVLTKEAQKDLAEFDAVVAKRIIRKLKWFEKQESPFRYGVLLRDSATGDVRFRIGDYRAIAVVDESRSEIIIVIIGHRRDVYRK